MKTDYHNGPFRRLTVTACFLAACAAPVSLASAGCTIASGPDDDTVEAGYPFIAQVTVSCDNGTFTWLKNGSIIPGATGKALVVDPVARSDSGARYRCIASGGVTSDTSREATLTVVPPKNVNRIIAISGDLLDASGKPVGDAGAAALEFTVRLYASAKGTAAIYTETFRGPRRVPVADGRFTVQLGRGEASGDLLKLTTERDNLYAELSTGPTGREEILGPRIPLTAAPYAQSGGIRVIYGNGAPTAAAVSAALGTMYVNTTDSTTWKRTASGWSEIE